MLTHNLESGLPPLSAHNHATIPKAIRNSRMFFIYYPFHDCEEERERLSNLWTSTRDNRTISWILV